MLTAVPPYRFILCFLGIGLAALNLASFVTAMFNLCLFVICRFLVKGRCIQKLEGIIAFELASLILFFTWLPIALDLVKVDAWSLFHIINGRELFDLALIFGPSFQLFSPRYRRFIMQHHLIGAVCRSALVAVTWFVLEYSEFREANKLLVLYYACSIFLVLPNLSDSLFLKSQSDKVKAVARISLFIVARIAHASVIVYSYYLLSLYVADPVLRLPLSAVILVIVGIPEFHSIKSAIPGLRKSYKMISGLSNSARDSVA